MVPSQILLSPLHFRAFHSPSCRLGQLTNTLMTWAEAAIDAGVSRCGPAYIFCGGGSHRDCGNGLLCRYHP